MEMMWFCSENNESRLHISRHKYAISALLSFYAIYNMLVTNIQVSACTLLDF